MASIIAAFSKPQDAGNIRAILRKNGYEPVFACTSGAQVLAMGREFKRRDRSLRLPLEDMVCEESRLPAPSSFDMLLIASPAKWSKRDTEGMICLSMPLKVHELLSTIEMMLEARKRRKRRKRTRPQKRSAEEKELILKAKALLMERNTMTEPEAYRYIQKCSMDNGTSLIENYSDDHQLNTHVR